MNYCGKIIYFRFLFDQFPCVNCISPAALAQILREAGESMTSMQTVLNRYVSLLETNTPEVCQSCTSNM